MRHVALDPQVVDYEKYFKKHGYLPMHLGTTTRQRKEIYATLRYKELNGRVN